VLDHTKWNIKKIQAMQKFLEAEKVDFNAKVVEHYNAQFSEVVIRIPVDADYEALKSKWIAEGKKYFS
jgi:predicted SprT family Zn-dependent metalloprotease